MNAKKQYPWDKIAIQMNSQQLQQHSLSQCKVKLEQIPAWRKEMDVKLHPSTEAIGNL